MEDFRNLRQAYSHREFNRGQNSSPGVLSEKKLPHVHSVFPVDVNKYCISLILFPEARKILRQLDSLNRVLKANPPDIKAYSFVTFDPEQEEREPFSGDKRQRLSWDKDRGFILDAHPIAYPELLRLLVAENLDVNSFAQAITGNSNFSVIPNSGRSLREIAKIVRSDQARMAEAWIKQLEIDAVNGSFSENIYAIAVRYANSADIEIKKPDFEKLQRESKKVRLNQALSRIKEYEESGDKLEDNAVMRTNAYEAFQLASDLGIELPELKEKYADRIVDYFVNLLFMYINKGTYPYDGTVWTRPFPWDELEFMIKVSGKDVQDKISEAKRLIKEKGLERV